MNETMLGPGSDVVQGGPNNHPRGFTKKERRDRNEVVGNKGRRGHRKILYSCLVQRKEF